MNKLPFLQGPRCKTCPDRETAYCSTFCEEDVTFAECMGPLSEVEKDAIWANFSEGEDN
jgi:hypothetical protein